MVKKPVVSTTTGFCLFLTVKLRGNEVLYYKEMY